MLRGPTIALRFMVDYRKGILTDFTTTLVQRKVRNKAFLQDTPWSCLPS